MARMAEAAKQPKAILGYVVNVVRNIRMYCLLHELDSKTNSQLSSKQKEDINGCNQPLQIQSFFDLQIIPRNHKSYQR
jgi:hypothetical protein